MSEAGRIAVLVARDGEASARAWALSTARIYRRTVLDMRGPKPRLTMYRRQLIDSYLALKRYALA